MISQTMPGATKMLVLLGLQHVERFLVGEARVVDDLDAVAHALLDRLAGAGMGTATRLPRSLASRDGHRDFLVAHPRELRAGDRRCTRPTG